MKQTFKESKSNFNVSKFFSHTHTKICINQIDIIHTTLTVDRSRISSELSRSRKCDFHLIHPLQVDIGIYT